MSLNHADLQSLNHAYLINQQQHKTIRHSQSIQITPPMSSSLLPCILIEILPIILDLTLILVSVPWSYYHIEGALKRAVRKTNCMKGSHWKPLADKVFLKLQFPFATGASYAFQRLVYGVEFIACGCSPNHSTHPCTLTLWGSGKDLKHGTMSMWTQRNTHSHALTFDETYYTANKNSDSLSTCCTIVQKCTHINTRHKHEVSEDCARRTTGHYQPEGNSFFKMKLLLLFFFTQNG